VPSPGASLDSSGPVVIEVAALPDRPWINSLLKAVQYQLHLITVLEGEGLIGIQVAKYYNGAAQTLLALMHLTPERSLSWNLLKINVAKVTQKYATAIRYLHHELKGKYI